MLSFEKQLITNYLQHAKQEFGDAYALRQKKMSKEARKLTGGQMEKREKKRAKKPYFEKSSAETKALKEETGNFTNKVYSLVLQT